MIDVKEAYRKLYKEQYEETNLFKLHSCVDIGDRWVFWFTTVGWEATISDLCDAVNKKTGEITAFPWFCNEANMKLVKNGIEIPIEEILA